ncbi:MAG: TIGR00282 family metallophosphoesterase [Bacilli bacterium]|nr:TIGR00282 family metallophosphoesterase [Bacilli bacterium]
MNVLIIGDVFSKLGRKSLEHNLKILRGSEKIHFVIVNGENASHGRGLNEGHYKWFLEQGIQVITLGNHSFSNRSIYKYIDDAKNLVRPANFGDGAKGQGYATVHYNQLSITVMQVIGQVFMNGEVVSPFLKAQEILDTVKSDIYICDFHGEATSEKIAFGYHFDGKMQVVFGTHTHVQTNDARILDQGTAFITDVGMTGPLEGVIGVEKRIILDRYLNNGLEKFSPQETGKTQFSAILVEINETTKKATKIKTIRIID